MRTKKSQEDKKMKQKFPFGATVTTERVAYYMEYDPYFAKFVLESLIRHGSGDWGDMSAEDKEVNDSALESGDRRIFSAYDIPKYLSGDDDKLWIITEWDRSVTTVLFPSEY